MTIEMARVRVADLSRQDRLMVRDFTYALRRVARSASILQNPDGYKLADPWVIGEFQIRGIKADARRELHTAAEEARKAIGRMAESADDSDLRAAAKLAMPVEKVSLDKEVSLLRRMEESLATG